jgi:molybdate transport system substrate-binding protein
LRAALLVAAVAIAGCGAATGGGGEAGRISVAAASDLRPAFEELGATFERRTGVEVRLTFGSSGQLARQLADGAPFDLFGSADVAYVDQVLESGRGDPETKATYAFGRIVVWAPERELRLGDLGDPGVRTVAIANPEHAPYGRAAREALERSGVVDDVEPKLVLGENVSDTLRLAQSGNADAAIVALSLARASQGRWSLVPERLHERLEQALVVTGEGGRGEAAGRFAAFVGSPEGRRVMRRYGFLLPGDRPTE